MPVRQPPFSAEDPMRVGVLISGRGSNLAALISEAEDKRSPFRIVTVISNRPTAPGLSLAADANVKTVTVKHQEYASREAFDERLTKVLKENDCDFVCLAGFMRILSPSFVHTWRGRLVNIHPSLLPSYKGLDTYRRMLEDGAKFGGCTVHFVNDALDDGPVVGQRAVRIQPGDEETSLSQRILNEEHILYPACLRAIAVGNVFLPPDI